MTSFWLIIKKIRNNKIGGEKKISVSEMVQKRVDKEKDKLYFHGKCVRSKKFQKRINRKSSTTLAYAIIINTIIIIGIIMVIWIILTITGG